MVKLALWLRLRAALTIVIIYNVKTIAKQKYNVRTIIHVSRTGELGFHFSVLCFPSGTLSVPSPVKLSCKNSQLTLYTTKQIC